MNDNQPHARNVAPLESPSSWAHLVISAILALLLLPLFHSLGLTLNSPWRDVFLLFWVRYGMLSIFAAAALYVVGQPREFIRAVKSPGPREPFPVGKVLGILVPAAYLFSVFFLVLCYNHLIVAAFFTGSADRLLARADSLLLMGHSVSEFAHYMVRHLSKEWLWFAESVYFSMFLEIGACIILLSAKSGFRSFRFVGAIATAYYLALLLFLILPATGPYYLCADHTGVWDAQDAMAQMQASAIAQVAQLHTPGAPSPTVGYYIALPCMHLVQPLIVLWFLREWRGTFWIVAIWSVLVLASIVVLEQHYVVDLIAAIPVALAAIAVVDWDNLKLLLTSGGEAVAQRA